MNAKLSAALSRTGKIVEWIYSHLGDNRTKNLMIFMLLAMTFFGMVAPERATQLRDIVLSMPF